MARSDPTRLMTVRRRQLSLGVVPLIALAFAAPIGASESVPFASDSGWLDPTEIDRAVRSFTGADIGEVGGARARADNRLRLAICAAPLATSWHGTRQAAVKVECARTSQALGGSSWQPCPPSKAWPRLEPQGQRHPPRSSSGETQSR